MPDGSAFYGPPETITDWRGQLWLHQFGEMYGLRNGVLRHAEDIRTAEDMAARKDRR